VHVRGLLPGYPVHVLGLLPRDPVHVRGLLPGGELTKCMEDFWPDRVSVFCLGSAFSFSPGCLNILILVNLSR